MCHRTCLPTCESHVSTWVCQLLVCVRVCRHRHHVLGLCIDVCFVLIEMIFGRLGQAMCQNPMNVHTNKSKNPFSSSLLSNRHDSCILWAYSLPRLSLVGLSFLWMFFSFVSPSDTIKENKGNQWKQSIPKEKMDNLRRTDLASSFVFLSFWFPPTITSHILLQPMCWKGWYC